MSNQGWVDFGKRIASRRKAKGWDQPALARRVGSTAATVGRWENGKTEPNPGALTALKRELGFTEADILIAFGELSAPFEFAKDTYEACSFRSAKNILGSFQKVFSHLLKIEGAFEVPAEPDEYGSDEKWLNLLELNPECGGVVFYENKEIVGFWQAIPVSDKTYEKIIRCENVNKTITQDDIDTFVESGIYKLYFVNFFIMTDHRNFITRRLLREDFTKFLKDLAKNDIFISRIAANVTGSEARLLCNRYGFEKIDDHPTHRYAIEENNPVQAEIYELDLAKCSSRLLAYDAFVLKSYIEKGIHTPAEIIR